MNKESHSKIIIVIRHMLFERYHSNGFFNLLNFFVVFHYLSQLVGVRLLNISGISDAWSEQTDPGDSSRQVALILLTVLSCPVLSN